jgi:hypothetical protein
MMENVKFAMVLATLLIAAAATGTFLASPTVSEMQVREAAFGPQRMLQLGLSVQYLRQQYLNDS